MSNLDMEVVVLSGSDTETDDCELSSTETRRREMVSENQEEMLAAYLRKMSPNNLAAIEAHVTLSTFETMSVLEILSAKIKPTATGEACFMKYRKLAANGAVIEGTIMAPTRLMTDFDRKTPCGAVYMGKAKSETAEHNHHVLRRIPTPPKCGRNALVEAQAKFRNMSLIEAQKYFNPRGLRDFPAFTVFSLVDCRVIKNAGKIRRTLVIASIKTVVDEVCQEGELYLPERFADTIKNHIPGVMIYKGMKLLADSSANSFHDCVFVKPSMVDKIELGKSILINSEPTIKRIKL